jgi:phage terminase large subunit
MSEKFVYTTAIHKIRKMKSRIKVIPGGSSAGKTFGILPILIDKAAKKSNLSISVVSESMPHLKRGAMRDFLKIMKITNRFIREHWNATNSIYTFSNGSYIEFFSADDDSKLRGARRNILYINECNNVTFDAYNQLAMRTSGDIYLDYNPTHIFWADTEVLKSPESEKLTLNYKDNEALSQTVIDFLEEKVELAKTSSYWKNWVDVYVHGKVGKLEGVVFDNWNEIKSIPENAKLVGIGLDFGFTNDPTAAVAVYQMDDNIYLDELIFQKGLSNGQIAKLLKAYELNCQIYADSAEPKSIAEIKAYGLPIFPTKKGTDSIKFGIDILQSFNIFITQRSANVKDEFSRYSWKKDREGNFENVPQDIFNHTIDAIRYLAMIKLSKRRKGRMSIMR